jgi:hypothetical protein
MVKATAFGVGFCLVIYLITGVIGYLMYGKLCTTAILNILGNDMKVFKGKDAFIVTILCIINVAFLISSTMSIPLMFFTLKKNFINSVIFCNKKSVSKEQSDDTSLHTVGQHEKLQFSQKLNPQPDITSSMSDRKKTLIITLLYISICFVTIVIPDLDIVNLY